MKSLNIYIVIFSIISCISCEDIINPELATAPDIIVVDAWINDLEAPQVIRVNRSQSYFANALPPAVTGAEVRIVDELGSVFTFDDNGDGSYVWTPASGEHFGTIGLSYTLSVSANGETFIATSEMKRIPVIDSVTFRFEEENFVLPDSYWGEFWARDIEGIGDTYWIKTYKNGELLSKPAEINIAYDAGFSAGGNVDGIIFIPPIRDALNPFDEEGDGEFLSPYVDGDSIYVEIHSITEDAFNFLTQVRLQTDRPGGFAELFAQPLSNVPSNVANANNSSEVVVQGFFNVSAVTSMGRRLDINDVRERN